jgi:hypothetical protein
MQQGQFFLAKERVSDDEEQIFMTNDRYLAGHHTQLLHHT